MARQGGGERVGSLLLVQGRVGGGAGFRRENGRGCALRRLGLVYARGFLWDGAAVLETISCISMGGNGEWRYFLLFLDGIARHCLVSWERCDGVCLGRHVELPSVMA
jgi:hypothetical protein